MKKFTLLFLALVIGFGIFTAQTKYNDDPRWSTNPNSIILPTGNGVSAPINTIPVTIFQKPRMVYYTPIGPLTVNQNIRPHPSANQHNEVYITRHPTNQNILLVANEPIGLPAAWIQAGLYFSTNSGLSWYGDDTLNAPSIADQRGDPAPTIDKNGTMIYTHLTSLTNFGGLKGMGANYSTDNGITFSATWDVEVNSNVDKNMSCTDDVPTSPYYGNSYMAYTLFNGSAANGHFSRTTNGGQSWSTFLTLNSTPANHFAQGHDVRVGIDGSVYVVWSAESSTSPYPADYLGVAKSTNGGLSFTATENAYDMNGARSASYNGWGIRTNDFPRMDIDKSGGSRNGWIYVVAGEYNLAPAGTDQDIVLHRSSDGGVTWNSPGIRVNQDAPNNGKVQFFPAVRVDEYGGVNVIYYDNRNFPSVGDSCSVFISRSLDGGNTFTDIEIADHHFKPKLLSGVNTMGDYIGITSANNKIWGAWVDDKTPLGNFQVWLGSIDLGPAIDHTPLTNSEQTAGTRAVNSIITPAGAPLVTSLTKLFYLKQPAAVYDSVQMINTSGNNWTANITLSGSGTYKYYIRTVDNTNRSAFAPAGAPTNFYSFTAEADVTAPVIVSTPLGNIPKIQWPATVTATVTDNIGVDSVWVEWYKNTPTPVKVFKLALTGSNNYTALFNSLNSDVTVGDIIYYKVKALDISSNKNIATLPLSGYYNFSIINFRICEDFSGGVVPPTGWAVSGTYWSYNSVSGYGTGTGSAKFDYYSATSGNNEYLTSLTFDPTLAGDSIKFDLAHAYYGASYIDSLIVEASTNSGVTYTALARMYAGTTFTATLCMSTVSTTSLFTPTAGQWKSRVFALPTGTNKVRFYAKSAYGNNLYIDNVCHISPPAPALSLGLTAMLSGYCNGTTMNYTKNVTVELHSATTPYALVESKSVLLDASGVGNPVYTTAVNGTPYYIVLKFDNGLETWSAAAQTFAGSTLNYNYTTAATQAYGSNLILVGTKWCVISGDVIRMAVLVHWTDQPAGMTGIWSEFM